MSDNNSAEAIRSIEDGEHNDVTAAYKVIGMLNSELSDALVQGGDHLTDDFPTGATVTSPASFQSEFDDGELVDDDLVITATRTVSMEAPAWKVDAFREQLEAFGGDAADVDVAFDTSGSFAAGVRYNDNGAPIPVGTKPDDENNITHTAKVSITVTVNGFRGDV